MCAGCQAGRTFNPFPPAHPLPQPRGPARTTPTPTPDPPTPARPPAGPSLAGTRAPAAPTVAFPCPLPSARRPRLAPRRADGEGVPPRPL